MSKSVRKGFTLIELLVVISIISILSVVGFVSYQNVTSKAKDARMRADIDAIKKAYETNYDPSANGGQGGYKQLQGSQFAGGQVPSQPNGSPYPYTVGPNASIAPYYRTDGYQVSATLSDGKIIYAVSTQGTLASQGTLGTCDPLGTLSNGLVGYWKMDEGSGITTVDSSGNGNDGILTNGPTWIQGKLDRAISFDGVDDYMNSNLDVSWNNTNSLSISFWIKPNNTSDTAGILGKIYPDWEWAFYQSGAAVSLVYWNESGGHTNGMDNGWGNVLQAG